MGYNWCFNCILSLKSEHHMTLCAAFGIGMMQAERPTLKMLVLRLLIDGILIRYVALLYSFHKIGFLSISLRDHLVVFNDSLCSGNITTR